MRTMSTRCLRVCIPAAPGFHHETRVEEPTEHTCLCVVTKLCVHLTSPQCVFGGIEASAFMAADEFRVAVVSSQLMH